MTSCLIIIIRDVVGSYWADHIDLDILYLLMIYRDFPADVANAAECHQFHFSFLTEGATKMKPETHHAYSIG